MIIFDPIGMVDDPVADQKAVSRRHRAGWVLADHDAGTDDLVEQPGMRRRVEPVDPTRQHRNGQPLGGQGTPVGRAVDPERSLAGSQLLIR